MGLEAGICFRLALLFVLVSVSHPRTPSRSAVPSAPTPSQDGPIEQPALLEALRARVAQLGNTGQDGTAGRALIPLCPGLPLAGLARGGLHELRTASPGAGAGFAAVLLGLAGGTVLWIAGGENRTMPWPPGLLRCGLPPERLILLRADRPEDALWAMEEALRCPALGGVLLSLDAKREAMLTLTATRRLQLAAEAGGGLGLLLRPERSARSSQSVALTRWQVEPDGYGLPSDPCWRLTLLRARGARPGGPWRLRWIAAEARLALESRGVEEQAP
jgi:protein ImuA